MSNQSFRSKSDSYFTQKFNEHGANPKGVDWNGTEAQEIRFEQLIKMIPADCADYTLNDLGCGYGALIPFLQSKQKYAKIQYFGYDVSPELVNAAREKYQSTNSSRFEFFHINDEKSMHEADYTLASGIFNIKFAPNNEEWLNYIIGVLTEMNNKSRKAFSFNMLTSYSDKEKQRPDLYYADPCWFFDYCKKNFSRNVSLLHDYNLYDFTILVNKAGN